MSIEIPDVHTVDTEIRATKARLQALCHLRKAAERQERTRPGTTGKHSIERELVPIEDAEVVVEILRRSRDAAAVGKAVRLLNQIMPEWRFDHIPDVNQCPTTNVTLRRGEAYEYRMG